MFNTLPTPRVHHLSISFLETRVFVLIASPRHCGAPMRATPTADESDAGGQFFLFVVYRESAVAAQRQAHRQTQRQTQRQTERQTERQAQRQA